MVIDTRTGSATKASTDDHQQLADVGMDYRSVPIRDGRRRDRHRFDTPAVASVAPLPAAYQAATGRDRSVLEQLATGPPTIEQIWFVATLRPNHPEHGISRAEVVVSQALDTTRGLYGWVTSGF